MDSRAQPMEHKLRIRSRQQLHHVLPIEERDAEALTMSNRSHGGVWNFRRCDSTPSSRKQTAVLDGFDFLALLSTLSPLCRCLGEVTPLEQDASLRLLTGSAVGEILGSSKSKCYHTRPTHRALERLRTRAHCTVSSSFSCHHTAITGLCVKTQLSQQCRFHRYGTSEVLVEAGKGHRRRVQASSHAAAMM
eukprot:655880-Amphidinium_carterae.1